LFYAARPGFRLFQLQRGLLWSVRWYVPKPVACFEWWTGTRQRGAFQRSCAVSRETEYAGVLRTITQIFIEFKFYITLKAKLNG